MTKIRKKPDKKKEPFHPLRWLRDKWREKLAWGKEHRGSVIATVVTLVLAVGIFFWLYQYSHTDMYYLPHSNTENDLFYEEAEVRAITKDTVERDQYSEAEIYIGTQNVVVRIKTGAFAGTNIDVTNHVSTFNGVRLKEGDSVIVCLEVKDGELINQQFATDNYSTVVYQVNRLPAILILFGVFVAITVLVGGRKGLKSLLGLAFTLVCLIWILCPLLMKGAEPVWTALLLCLYIEIVCFTLLEGMRKKTVCAMLGTFAGMALAAVFGILAQKLTKINSFNLIYDGKQEIEQFHLMKDFVPLKIHGLLTAGIIISSLGAVMDVAMSLSSSIQELKTVNPELTHWQLWRSGMRIGRDMVGTMTNTLILAFVGSGLTLILYMWAQNLPFHYLMSSVYLSAELIPALASSIGVILAVPLTVLIGAMMFGKKKE